MIKRGFIIEDGNRVIQKREMWGYVLEKFEEIVEKMYLQFKMVSF